MSAITFDTINQASYPGGSSALTSQTNLVPAGGEQALIAPAKYKNAANTGGATTYVFERRYVDDQPVTTVMIDSRTSSANRLEDALIEAIEDEHPILSQIPRLHVIYSTADPIVAFTEIEAPHRAFDAHFRLGTHEGVSVTAVHDYIQARNATPANAAALFLLSPDTVLFGGWDSTRKSHQARFAANVVGEIIGVVADQHIPPAQAVTRRSGARIDPVAPSFNFTPAQIKQLNESISQDPQGQPKQGKKAADFLIGAIPPSVINLDGIATSRIIRSHVISFAMLRRLRFGMGAEGDAAIRTLLAAVAIDLITRSDADLVLRANAHLREADTPVLTVDHRFGKIETLDYPTVEEADALLQQAYEHARQTAQVDWHGQIFEVEGNPAIPGAADATADAAKAA